MTYRNEHLANLGFQLVERDTCHEIEPLLRTCNLDPLGGVDVDAWRDSRYLAATTQAGGNAACIGWNRDDRDEDLAVLHSLAVAPSSRRSGIGASLVASALGHLMDADPVRDVYLITDVARAFFSRFGFNAVDRADRPDAIEAHPLFEEAHPDATSLMRPYRPAKRGLDQCAFRLIRNTTSDEQLPVGSVFFFEQSGSMIEARYQGHPVERGHLLARIDDRDFRFVWQQYADGELVRGEGEIDVDVRDDGRRELREKFGDDPGERMLREV